MRNRILLIIFSLLFAVQGWVYGGSTPTANFGLDKPAIGDTGWGSIWNDNLDRLDSILKDNTLSLSVTSSASPQLKLKYDGSHYADIGVSSGGDLTLDPTGGDIFALDKVTVTDTGVTQLSLNYDGSNKATFGVSSGGNLTVTPTGNMDIAGSLGVNESSPDTRLHVTSSGAQIATFETTGSTGSRITLVQPETDETLGRIVFGTSPTGTDGTTSFGGIGSRIKTVDPSALTGNLEFYVNTGDSMAAPLMILNPDTSLTLYDSNSQTSNAGFDVAGGILSLTPSAGETDLLYGGGNSVLKIDSTNGSDGDAEIQFSTGVGGSSVAWTIGADDSNSDTFNIATGAGFSSPKVTINSSGYVGIGDSTPDAPLDVAGSIASDNFAIYRSPEIYASFSPTTAGTIYWKITNLPSFYNPASTVVNVWGYVQYNDYYYCTPDPIGVHIADDGSNPDYLVVRILINDSGCGELGSSYVYASFLDFSYPTQSNGVGTLQSSAP